MEHSCQHHSDTGPNAWKRARRRAGSVKICGPGKLDLLGKKIAAVPKSYLKGISSNCLAPFF